MSISCEKSISINVLGGPSLYWSFEDTAPPPFVDKVQGLGISPVFGTATQVPGKIGNGVHLDGAQPFDSLGEVGNGGSGLTKVAYAGQGLTYITWFKIPLFSALQNNPQILALQFRQIIGSVFATVSAIWESFAGGAFGVVLDATAGGGGTLVAQQPAFTFGDNAWHFFAVVYDGTAGTLKYRFDASAYVNNTVGPIWGGIFTGQASYVLPALGFGKFAFLGGGGSNGDEYFDESGLWLSRKLSDAEIDFWYNGGAGRTFP